MKWCISINKISFVQICQSIKCLTEGVYTIHVLSIRRLQRLLNLTFLCSSQGFKINNNNFTAQRLIVKIMKCLLDYIHEDKEWNQVLPVISCLAL